jgi:hypothetical protein
LLIGIIPELTRFETQVFEEDKVILEKAQKDLMEATLSCYLY